MGWQLFQLNQWKDPDHRVRLNYARRSKKQSKLFYLALNDVHESVRVAAVKNLESDHLLLQILRQSDCSKSLAIAVGMLCTDEALSEAAAFRDLDVELRLDAIGRVVQHSEPFLLQLALDPEDQLAIHAISRCADREGLEAIYSEDFSDARAVAIIEKMKEGDFCYRIFETSPKLERRLAALDKISQVTKLREYYFEEHEVFIRSKIISKMNDDSRLAEFFEDEDDEALRVAIVEKMSDAEWLHLIACEDYNIEARRAAVRGIEDADRLARIAVKNEDRVIHEIVFGKGLGDEQLTFLAKEATHPYVRVEAISRIEDPEILESLADASSWPDVVWFCSRAVGKMPISVIRQIQSSEVLVRAARQETQKIARMAAIREIRDPWALEDLKQSEDPEVAEAAHCLGAEVEGPCGLRFLSVPGRPYQLSIFPVTGEQFSKWKEDLGDPQAAEKYARLQDLPVTDIEPEQARQFCKWLSRKDDAFYRLPLFDEWRHAAVCDDENWFSTGRLRAFQNQEEAEMVLFGQKHGVRPLHESVSNPWGFLDMIGNIMEWTGEPVYSEQALRAGIAVDEFARKEGAGSPERPNLHEFAYASGNHWADRRIRPGRWKRLIHLDNLKGSVADKVGFRVLRVDPLAKEKAFEYELTLLPEVAHGYSLSQVCRALGK
ncbi:MAG: formylglycine-generating enzyme family protein, partial [Opitutales bacterium]